MPLILAVDELASNIRNTKVRFLRPGSMQPDMPRRYDEFTLREPLCNCIAHVNDSPSSYYLNPFLVEAMRNVDLIDTEGGGIKHLFELQRERMFPMPEYDINDGKVKLTITGHVDNKAYANLLIERPELTLEEVMHLDCIAKKERQNIPLDNSIYDQVDNAATPFQTLSHEDRKEWVHKLFQHLPEKQRIIMQLRDIEGKPYKEIAKLLQISEEQVKVTLFRARQRIRNEFEKIDHYGL